MTAPIAILGGGLAGLTAARVLRTAGVPFTLFEATATLGGLASSHRDAGGFSDDVGVHFVTNRLAAAIGASAQCYRVPRYGESVWLGDRSVAYPFGLIGTPRYAASAARMIAARAIRRAPIRSAADWFSARYGNAIAREIALPLIEAWSGLPAERLALSVGEQMPGSIVRSLALKAAGSVLDRAIASGYCGSLPESPHVFHVYPYDGVATFCHRLAEGLEDAVRYETPVQQIHVENDRVVGIRAGDCEIEASAVISTAPIEILASLVRGTNALERYRRFRHRPMVFVNLRLQGRNLLPDVVVWTPLPGSPIFRLTEGPLAMPTLAPEGKTTITVDIGAQIGDEYWTMSDEALAEVALEHVAPLVPDARARFLGVRTVRTPIAYPVLDIEYEADRLALEGGLPVDGLYTVGRNGEFRNILMEDVYWRTRRRMQAVIARYRDSQVLEGNVPPQPIDAAVL